MSPRFLSKAVLTGLILTAFFSSVFAQQSHDEVYGEKIKAYTTDERFRNELIDYLPASDQIPSPLQHFGEIIGAPGILHYTSEIFGYLKAVADASPRVTWRKIGESEEGRDMLEFIVADEQTIGQLDAYRDHLKQLADPRKLTADHATGLIDQAKPIYYVTAGLHSPETGSPEMVMELIYRLAVDEAPHIQKIRQNVIVIINPATEVDGRDRIVDIYKYRKTTTTSDQACSTGATMLHTTTIATVSGWLWRFLEICCRLFFIGRPQPCTICMSPCLTSTHRPAPGRTTNSSMRLLFRSGRISHMRKSPSSPSAGCPARGRIIFILAGQAII